MKIFQYQNKKQHNYFEGWYLRLTDPTNNVNLALIFAITKDKTHPHSFIQVYDGTAKQATYHEFATDAFHFDYDTMTASFESNYLSLQEAVVQTDDIDVKASISNHAFLTPYKGHQSAMGFLANAPLECFQEIVYLTADAEFTINGTTYHGTAYMEKTYGTNFPSKWIWLQSNHSTNQTTLSFSVGHVPVLFFKVKGFLLVYEHNGVQHRYGSFNFSRIKILSATDKQTTFEVRKGTTRIRIEATTHAPVKLVGPRKKGIMDLDVFESITASATMKVYQNDSLVLDETFEHVGLEIMY